MAASTTKKNTTSKVDPKDAIDDLQDGDFQDDDLLDDLDEDGDDGDDEEEDLLDSIEEDDSEGWVPEEKGDGIQGVVLRVTETPSDYDDSMAPTVVVETKDGEKRRIIGYGQVLGNEIRARDPQPGDVFACKYFGVKKSKAGREYKSFGVSVRKGKK